MNIAKHSKVALVALTIISSIWVSGCGPSKTDVKGKVSYQGKALNAGSVTLVATDGTVFTAKIEADGSFTISGIPQGSVKVGVVGANASRGTKPLPGGREPKGDAPPPAAPATGGIVIPTTYTDPNTSGVTATVKKEEVLTIDLK